MEIQEIAELAQVSIEEVFYSDPQARAEYEAQCEIRLCRDSPYHLLRRVWCS